MWYKRENHFLNMLCDFGAKKRVITINVRIFYSVPTTDDNQQPPSNTSTLRNGSQARTPSVPELSQPTRTPVLPPVVPVPSLPRNNDDIRLCTIYRADPTDTFGIELNYHRREQFHSLNIVPGQNNERSSRFFINKFY